jgi:hypothetical protein
VSAPTDYAEFLAAKANLSDDHGFAPLWVPDFLFDFQRALVEWGIRKGRNAIFADCGMGKTPMQLVWAENVVRHTNKPVLIVTPLAVADQTVGEAGKFGIDAVRSKDGNVVGGSRVVVTNYDRLHLFDPSNFAGMVCDESSAIKNFDGAHRQLVTEFMRKLRYRMLCTATAAPNDYVELGTSSEALGEMGHMDMLSRFFKNDQNSTNPNRLWDGGKWRFKHHAEQPFWRWVCSWARALRKPSDLGFSDDSYTLPQLRQVHHIVKANNKKPGMLFELPAVGLADQREELRRTLNERCAKAAELVSHDEPAVMWCHLNDEGDLLERIVPDAKQVKGSQSDDEKEELFKSFASGQLRVLVTKPKIGAWGLNWQHCSRMTFFPSHSFEQYYQAVRRCWRFGQKNEVRVDVVATEGQRDVMENLDRKARACEVMFASLVEHMNDSMRVVCKLNMNQKEEVPSWL